MTFYRYIRTKQKEEVDFCIVRDKKPWLLVECKSQSTELSRTLRKFSAMFSAAMAFQLTSTTVDRVVPGSNIRLINTEQFLSMFI